MRVASAALLLLGLTAVAANAQVPAPGPPIVSPELLPDGRVTFRLLAPQATSVSVTGDWPGGIESTTTQMTKDEKGIWSATVGPLKPEFWIYTFTVDGVTTLDPRNVNTRRNANRIENTLLVPGPASADYMVDVVPHGTVALQWYPSPTVAATRRVFRSSPRAWSRISSRSSTRPTGPGPIGRAARSLACRSLMEFPGYIHEWPVWRVSLRDLLPRLFQSPTSPSASR